MHQLASAYEAATGMSRSAIGLKALKDNTFFVRLGAGGGFNIRTYDRLVGWFSAEWPAGVLWPDGVEHPSDERSDQ